MTKEETTTKTKKSRSCLSSLIRLAILLGIILYFDSWTDFRNTVSTIYNSEGIREIFNGVETVALEIDSVLVQEEKIEDIMVNQEQVDPSDSPKGNAHTIGE